MKGFTIRRFSLLVCLVGMFWGTAKSQPFTATCSHYSTDDGLASNAIGDIVQDDYGYIWIATWNGLSRFDGYHFYNYKTGVQSGVPLLHNRIVDLKVDLSQNIWLRMYDGRIFVLERTTDRIINPLASIAGHRDLRTDRSLTVTGNGDVLAIISDDAIYRMHLDRNGLAVQHISTGQLHPTSICEGYHNDLWVGTQSGIHRLNLTDATIEQQGEFADEHIDCMYSNGFNIYAGAESGRLLSFAYGQQARQLGQLDRPIRSIYVDGYQTMWCTTTQPGLFRIHIGTGDVKHFVQPVAVPQNDLKGALISEVGGIVWATMSGGGFGYYNREADKMEFFHNNPAEPWSLSNTVNAYLVQREGVVWESTTLRGLEKLEIQKNNIPRTRLTAPGTVYNINEVRALCYDPRHHWLVAGNKYGMLFTGTPGNSPSLVVHDEALLGRIYGITLDRQGRYWLSTKGHGLIRATVNASGNWHFDTFRHSDKDPYSLISDDVYCAVEDHDGNIWVATYGGGVNILTTAGNRPRFLHHGNTLRHYPHDAFLKVRTLTVDREGRVWAGSTDGLLVMSFKKGRFTIERVEPSEDISHALGSYDIVALGCAADGTVWVGTNGGGLARTVGRDAHGRWLFETFGTPQGLASEEIRSLTFDRQGNVWLAADHTLAMFDVKKHVFSNFTIQDGVDNTLCSEGAALCTTDGRLLFGTLDGYYTVDPQKLANGNGSDLKLRITDFLIDGTPQSPRTDSTYAFYVPETGSVTLSSPRQSFAFRFAALNHSLQHRVHYQYRLDGYDVGWKNATHERIAAYQDVPSGHYRFHVRAYLSQSPDRYDERTVELIVPPPFLLSSAAVWLYMILAATIALGLMYWRQQQLVEKARQ